MDYSQQAINPINEGNFGSIGFLSHAANNFSYAATENQKNTPSQQAIDCYVQSAHLYQQAIDATNEGKPKVFRLLRDAAHLFSIIADEAQQNPPNQQAINLYFQCASLYQQAANVENEGNSVLSNSLRQAAKELTDAASRARKSDSNKQNNTIDFYLQSATLHQQAANAENEGKSDLSNSLREAAYYFSLEGNESQKYPFDPQVINNYLQTAAQLQSGG